MTTNFFSIDGLLIFLLKCYDKHKGFAITHLDSLKSKVIIFMNMCSSEQIQTLQWMTESIGTFDFDGKHVCAFFLERVFTISRSLHSKGNRNDWTRTQAGWMLIPGQTVLRKTLHQFLTEFQPDHQKESSRKFQNLFSSHLYGDRSKTPFQWEQPLIQLERTKLYSFYIDRETIVPCIYSTGRKVQKLWNARLVRSLSKWFSKQAKEPCRYICSYYRRLHKLSLLVWNENDISSERNELFSIPVYSCPLQSMVMIQMYMVSITSVLWKRTFLAIFWSYRILVLHNMLCLALYLYTLKQTFEKAANYVLEMSIKF